MKTCVIIVGPSGSGKSTLERNLVETYPDDFYKTISFTTREPRVGEVDGFDYHFLTQEEFDKTDKVEHITFGGNHYGLDRAEFTKDDKHIICVVEPTGAGQIIHYLKHNDLRLEPAIIFMDIPLKTRINNMLIGRSQNEAEIEKRLKADNIQQQFLESDLVRQVKKYKRIKKLTPLLMDNVLAFIRK